MILVVPAAFAVTIPVVAFTVATEGLLLDHAPPVVPVELYCAVAPIQSGVVPLTIPAVAFPFTVIIADTKLLPQAVVTVYLISAEPADIPLTKPFEFTVAEALLLLHTPPVVVLLSC